MILKWKYGNFGGLLFFVIELELYNFIDKDKR